MQISDNVKKGLVIGGGAAAVIVGGVGIRKYILRGRELQDLAAKAAAVAAEAERLAAEKAAAEQATAEQAAALNDAERALTGAREDLKKDIQTITTLRDALAQERGARELAQEQVTVLMNNLKAIETEAAMAKEVEATRKPKKAAKAAEVTPIQNAAPTSRKSA
jgi:uncharacterized coiled-coil protein SlyX